MSENRRKRVIPSLICSDLCNIEASVNQLKSLGFDMIHVDILDGHFSPSMPLGFEIVSQLRSRVKIGFDVHLMTDNYDFFIDEMINIGCERLCFHYENVPHVDYILNKIRKNGIEVGIALKPATPVIVLDEIINELDFVLLMLINPGFASSRSENQIPYAVPKVKKCREYLNSKKIDIPIEVDGRISFSNLMELADVGADDFVAGTTLLFNNHGTLEENKNKIDKLFMGKNND